MNLRFRIFLWIGGLFFLAFVASQFIEEVMTSKSLTKEEHALQKTIIEQDEGRRENIERYVRNILNEYKQQMLVLFSKIQNYNWLYTRFTPSVLNAQNGTWLASASLIDANKWIDFIQNTNEGQLVSQIVIDDLLTEQAVLIHLDRDLTLCVTRKIDSSTGWEGPFVAIGYDYEEITYDTNHFIQGLSINPNRDNGYRLLFRPENFMQLKIPVLKERFQQIDESWSRQGVDFEPSSNYYQIMEGMIKRIEAAQSYFLLHEELYRSITLETKKDWIQKNLKPDTQACHQPVIAVDDPVSTERLSRRFDQIVNIWQICTLLSTKLFGSEPFSFEFPVGICQMQGAEECGEAFFNRQMLFDQFNISSRKYQGKIGSEPDVSIVVYKDQSDRLFFGGILSLTDYDNQGNVRRGTLTLAIDARSIVKNLSLASNAMTLFVSGGQVLAGYTGDGETLAVEDFKIPLAEITNQNSGFFAVEGTEYFFLLLKPYPDLDMNFYILSPKNREFALVTVLNTTAKGLIDQISNQMHLIVAIALVLVLIILNNIVRHITYPISFLAKACEKLTSGQLADIELPDLKKKKKDEVYTLYHSFKDMIAGLKEKEKVMGVLNKVVSPTIAQEILKGRIHLGGEEKVVTVLFADIRHFTQLTEKMTPHEVIDMLNTCMTRVSHVVDEYQGVIDKYVGDEVMALFGAPLPLDNAPLKAIECAFKIHQELEKWNEERSSKQLPKVEMGIGIHSGLMVAGNMGAENRLNYTVLGSNVNLSSRLCSLAAPGEILVSQNTLQFPAVLDQFEVEPLPPVRLKGFSETVSVFKIIRQKNPVSR